MQKVQRLIAYGLESYDQIRRWTLSLDRTRYYKNTYFLNLNVYYMKIKTELSFKTKLLIIALFALLFTSCKKDYVSTKSEIVITSDVSQIATDVTVTVQPGILPPATPQS